MPLRCCPKEYVADSSPSAILGILRYPDALSYLIRRGEAYAVNLLCQRVRVLLHRLDGQIPVGFVDTNSSPGTDTMAVKEEHDLANLHPLLPGIGDPLPTLWPDTVDGLQIGGVVANHVQDPCTEVSDQLLCQNGADSFHEAAGQIPFDALIRCWRNRFQDRGLELKTVLFIPDPPSLCGQPLSGAYRRQ